MSTEYGLTDSLPKDKAAQKLMAWIDDGTSQQDFALPRGIGSEGMGNTSRITAHLGVGTHTIGSAIGTGVVATGGLLFNESPSAVGTGNVVAARGNRVGHQFVQQASTILSFDATSTQTHIGTSALLNYLEIHLSDVNANDFVEISDGAALRLKFEALTNGSAQFREAYPGLFFGTSIKHTRSISPAAGAASVLVGYMHDGG